MSGNVYSVFKQRIHVVQMQLLDKEKQLENKVLSAEEYSSHLQSATEVSTLKRKLHVLELSCYLMEKVQ